MGRFYNARCVVMFLLNIFTFPYLLLYIFSIKTGWRRWYRRWRYYFFRLVGSNILKKWTFQLHKGKFLGRLKEAQRNIAKH